MAGLTSHFYLKISGSDAPVDLMRDLSSVEVDDNLFLPDMFVILLFETIFLGGFSTDVKWEVSFIK